MIHLTEHHLDSLKEIINIGMGRAASSLNQLLELHIDLFVPELIILQQQSLPQWFATNSENVTSVKMEFGGIFDGHAQLILPFSSARLIVKILNNSKTAPETFDAMTRGMLAEVGNIILNGVMGSLSNMLGQNLTYRIPTYSESTLSETLQLNNLNSEINDVVVLVARAHFAIKGSDIEGDVYLTFVGQSFNRLITEIDAL